LSFGAEKKSLLWLKESAESSIENQEKLKKSLSTHDAPSQRKSI
jgi:hypothetical protein